MKTRNIIMMSAGLLAIGVVSALSLTAEPEGPAKVPPAGPGQLPATEGGGVQQPQPPGTSTVNVTPSSQALTTASSGPLSLKLALEYGVVSESAGETMAMVEARASSVAGEMQTPTALAIVLDVSGSMAGNKLENARQAARELVNRLHDGDRITLVSFAEDSVVHLQDYPLGVDRSHALTEISRLGVRGTTCMSCGLNTAYDIINRAPTSHQRRVIILSDGQANQGVQDVAGLSRLSGKARTGATTITSTIGLGRGYDESIMNAVAEGGAGGYYFVHNSRVISKVLSEELQQLRTSVVRDLSIDLSAGSGFSVGQELGTYRRAAGPTFASARSVYVGSIEADGTRRVVLPLRLPAGALGEALVARARYTDAGGNLHTVKLSVPMRRSADAALVAASRSPDVTAQVARLRSVESIDLAIEAQQAGDTGRALNILQGAAATLDQVAADTGDDDVKAEAAENRVLQRKLQEFKPGSLGMRATSLLNSARGAEVRRGKKAGKMYHRNDMYEEAETE